MDFDNRKVYGDTSITDGLVLGANYGFILLQADCTPLSWTASPEAEVEIAQGGPIAIWSIEAKFG